MSVGWLISLLVGLMGFSLKKTFFSVNIFTKKKLNLEGEQDAAELGANIGENHTCIKVVWKFFLHLFFFLMVMKEKVILF